MHRLMDNYGEPLSCRGKKEYFDDMIYFLRRDHFDESMTRGIEEYGNELWRMMARCTSGFCHGDMHTGNTKYLGGQFIWKDFDRAGLSYPVYDLSWLANCTDFVVFNEKALNVSRRLFDEIYAGYCVEQTMTDNDIVAVFHFIAIIHLDANDIILKNRTVDRSFMAQQHDWLMRWREACGKLA